jgi:hypothetical protein
MESWTVRHFSTANPAGPGQTDVPALLRRVADSIEQRGDIEVQDVVFRLELEDEGWCPTMTVYFHQAGDD